MCLSFYQKREAVWAERRREENKLVAFLAFSCAENRSHVSVSVNIQVPKSKSSRAHRGAACASWRLQTSSSAHAVDEEPHQSSILHRN